MCREVAGQASSRDRQLHLEARRPEEAASPPTFFSGCRGEAGSSHDFVVDMLYFVGSLKPAHGIAITSNVVEISRSVWSSSEVMIVWCFLDAVEEWYVVTPEVR